MIYSLRRGPFAPVATWRLEGGALVEERSSKPARRFLLADLRALRIAPGANRYARGERVLRLLFRKGAVSVGSHGFHGFADYRDQGAAFDGFAKAVLARAAQDAPAARFERGAATGSGMFAGAAAILAAGVVLASIGAVAAGQLALGLEIGARLSFMLLLMFAVSPWTGRGNPRAFDPASPPPDLLA